MRRIKQLFGSLGFEVSMFRQREDDLEEAFSPPICITFDVLDEFNGIQLVRCGACHAEFTRDNGRDGRVWECPACGAQEEEV
jgi:hypothetical protein